ncbi:MAG: hypothetical protein ABSB40_06580 [Nitrososphaeria archaeon]
MNTYKPSRATLALSALIVFAATFVTLTIAHFLGLEPYAPFIGGVLAALVAIVLSLTLWKPHNQGIKP